MKKIGYVALVGVVVAGAAVTLNMSKEDKSQFVWYEDAEYVAQGLGDVDGKRLTNSYEAFESNYNEGHRLFETNFVFTSDGGVVAREDWRPYTFKFLGQETKNESVLSEEEFSNLLIHGKYNPLTLDEMISLLENYEDASLIVTSNGLSEEQKKMLFEDIDRRVKAKEVLERIIPQVTSMKELEAIKEQGNFKTYLYDMSSSIAVVDDEVMNSLLDSNVKAVLMNKEQIGNSDISRFKEREMAVFVDNINESSEVEKLVKEGAQGVFTDFLNPSNESKEKEK